MSLSVCRASHGVGLTALIGAMDGGICKATLSGPSAPCRQLVSTERVTDLRHQGPPDSRHVIPSWALEILETLQVKFFFQCFHLSVQV